MFFAHWEALPEPIDTVIQDADDAKTLLVPKTLLLSEAQRTFLATKAHRSVLASARCTWRAFLTLSAAHLDEMRSFAILRSWLRCPANFAQWQARPAAELRGSVRYWMAWKIDALWIQRFSYEQLCALRVSHFQAMRRWLPYREVVTRIEDDKPLASWHGKPIPMRTFTTLGFAHCMEALGRGHVTLEKLASLRPSGHVLLRNYPLLTDMMRHGVLLFEDIQCLSFIGTLRCKATLDAILYTEQQYPEAPFSIQGLLLGRRVTWEMIKETCWAGLTALRTQPYFVSMFLSGFISYAEILKLPTDMQLKLFFETPHVDWTAVCARYPLKGQGFALLSSEEGLTFLKGLSDSKEGPMNPLAPGAALFSSCHEAPTLSETLERIQRACPLSVKPSAFLAPSSWEASPEEAHSCAAASASSASPPIPIPRALTKKRSSWRG